MAMQSISTNEVETLHLNSTTTNGEERMAFDLIIIGLGTKGLAAATALADANPRQQVLVIEQKQSFESNTGYSSPDNAVGSYFLHDLITTRNPKSEFTFVNFLHASKLLLDFANVSKLHPSRRLMRLYMEWVAEHIRQLGWIAYGMEAINVRPQKAQSINGWTVGVKDVFTGEMSSIYSKRLVIATGASSNLPKALSTPEVLPFVVPLEESANVVTKARQSTPLLRVAVIGDNQEAVELFEALHSLPEAHQATLFFRGSSLRPDQGSVFGPEAHDSRLPPEIRRRMSSKSDVQPAQPAIDLNTLNRLYTLQYTQYVKHSDAESHRLQLRPLAEVIEAHIKEGKVHLAVRDTNTGKVETISETYDIVVAQTMTGPARADGLLAKLLPELPNRTLAVSADYQVHMAKAALAPGCGLWVLGSLTGSSVRRDNFASLAEIGGRLLASVTGKMENEGRHVRANDEVAML